MTVKQFNRLYQAERPIIDMLSDTIEEYVFYLRQNTNMSNVSLVIRRTKLKSLFNYFYRKGYKNYLKWNLYLKILVKEPIIFILRHL